jgi:hypothetical protein
MRGHVSSNLGITGEFQQELNMLKSEMKMEIKMEKQSNVICSNRVKTT